MYATLKYTAAIVMAGLGVLGSATDAQAFNYRRVDLQALRLQRLTAAMHDEVHAHFRPSPSYRHLDADVSQMEQLARHIHEVAHHRGSIAHLRADVERLDHLFHHIEDLLRAMTRAGRVDCRALAHFRGTMRSIDRVLHNLRADLRAMDYRDPNHFLPGRGHGGHAGHGHGRIGRTPGRVAPAPAPVIRVGNGRFGFQFRIGR